jgi:lipoprotein-releasing system ATP-binding protein
MNKAVIQAYRLFKSFTTGGGRVEVLRGLDLEVACGELVAIMGPSGAGKSTLLHLLGALDRPTSGKIWMKGEEIPFGCERELAKIRLERVGFVFQSYNLLPELTALENAALPGLIKRSEPKEVYARARAALERMGLGERIGHLPGELSLGEIQRVAIARALINEPEILLADEPTGNLDRRMGEEIFDVILGVVHEMGLCGVIATHNEALAARTDRVLRLIDGRLLS